jgi:hypothetical protein
VKNVKTKIVWHGKSRFGVIWNTAESNTADVIALNGRAVAYFEQRESVEMQTANRLIRNGNLYPWPEAVSAAWGTLRDKVREHCEGVGEVRVCDVARYDGAPGPYSLWREIRGEAA